VSEFGDGGGAEVVVVLYCTVLYCTVLLVVSSAVSGGAVRRGAGAVVVVVRLSGGMGISESDWLLTLMEGGGLDTVAREGQVGEV
jgi:hypothetical protein